MQEVFNMDKYLQEFAQQIAEAVELADTTKINGSFRQVVVCGVGSSAVVGDMLATLLRDELPIVTVRDYVLPATVNDDSLVFVISYSGDTEEAIAMFSDAQKKNATVVVLTTGGKLKGFCQEQEIPYLNLPKGMPSRCALAHTFFPILVMLENSGLIKPRRSEIRELIDFIRNANYREKAIGVAEKIGTKIPLIFVSSRLSAVGLRWRTMFLLNAKTPSWNGVFPEVLHTDLIGFTKNTENYFVFLIKDERDNPQLQRRIDATKDFLQGRGIEVLELNIKGNSPLVKLISCAHFGDWISYHSAKKRGVDPVKVEILDEFSKGSNKMVKFKLGI